VITVSWESVEDHIRPMATEEIMECLPLIGSAADHLDCGISRLTGIFTTVHEAFCRRESRFHPHRWNSDDCSIR
jgi:hypothetical protein